MALLVLTNQARSNPSANGGSGPAQPPLVWNDDLAAAARFHSDDMGENGCFGHSSCNGGSWDSRVSKYYKNWRYIGENVIAMATDPRDMHAGWMGSEGHRSNILSGFFSEFGAGIGWGEDGFGPVTYATENFGMRGMKALNALPLIPAGAVLPRIGGAGDTREFMANYYHYTGDAPAAVRALVGSSCVSLSLAAGSAGHGTYKATRSVSGSGCVPLVFEAVRADGVRYRFPESGAILIGVGSSGASCAERTTTLPTASCGGGDPSAPTPTPTPTPAEDPDPTPAGHASAGLDDVKLVLKPGPPNSSKGQVSFQAVLSAPPAFDPTAGDVRISADLTGSGEYVKVLPQACAKGPCMKESSNGKVFSGHYATKSLALSFVLARDGTWRMRFSAKHETLSHLAPGPVVITVKIGDVTASTTVPSRLKETSLIAQ